MNRDVARQKPQKKTFFFLVQNPQNIEMIMRCHPVMERLVLTAIHGYTICHWYVDEEEWI